MTSAASCQQFVSKKKSQQQRIVDEFSGKQWSRTAVRARGGRQARSLRSWSGWRLDAVDSTSWWRSRWRRRPVRRPCRRRTTRRWTTTTTTSSIPDTPDLQRTVNTRPSYCTSWAVAALRHYEATAFSLYNQWKNGPGVMMHESTFNELVVDWSVGVEFNAPLDTI